MNTENLSTADKLLWEKANKRVKFKQNLVVYSIVNSFLIATWFFSGSKYFWPIWSLGGWGLGLAFQYFDAYTENNWFSSEVEFKKLKDSE